MSGTVIGGVGGAILADQEALQLARERTQKEAFAEQERSYLKLLLALKAQPEPERQSGLVATIGRWVASPKLVRAIASVPGWFDDWDVKEALYSNAKTPPPIRDRISSCMTVVELVREMDHADLPAEEKKEIREEVKELIAELDPHDRDVVKARLKAGARKTQTVKAQPVEAPAIPDMEADPVLQALMADLNSLVEGQDEAPAAPTAPEGEPMMFGFGTGNLSGVLEGEVEEIVDDDDEDEVWEDDVQWVESEDSWDDDDVDWVNEESDEPPAEPLLPVMPPKPAVEASPFEHLDAPTPEAVEEEPPFGADDQAAAGTVAVVEIPAIPAGPLAELPPVEVPVAAPAALEETVVAPPAAAEAPVEEVQKKPEAVILSPEERAELEALPEDQKAALAGMTNRPEQIVVLIRERSPVVLGAILDNPNLSESILVTHTALFSSRQIQLLLKKKRWSRRTPIRQAILYNANTPPTDSLGIVDEINDPKSLLGIMRSPKILSPQVKQKAKDKMVQRYWAMPVPSRTLLIRQSGPAIFRDLWEQIFRDETTLAELVRDRGLEEGVVVQLCRSAMTPRSILGSIAANGQWSNKRTVLHAIIRNPKTPRSALERLIPKLNPADKKKLRKDASIPPALRARLG